MKKVISLFLSVAMLLSIVSVVDFSAYAYVETGKCGDNLTYSLDTSKGVLTISGTGKMTDYLMGNPFSKFNVKTVIIENGVTSIGYQAFCGCTRVVDVIVPDSVTSIGDSAFYNCQKLNNITIPNSVTSIGNSVFYNCTNLLRITLPGLENIGKYSLCECPNLRRIEYYGTKNQWNKICKLQNNSKLNNVETFCIDGLTGSFDPITYSTKDYLKFKIDDNVTLVGYDKNKMKSKNINVDSIEFAGFKFNVTSIGNSAFRSCTSLTSVTIGNSVTSIDDYAFEGCTSLTNITIPNSVTSIGSYAFTGCVSLKSVTIPNSVTSIGDNAFYKCASLTDIIIPNSVTSIGNSTFEYCTSLTSVTIPNSVTSIGGSAFSGCTSLTSVTIPNSVTSIGGSAFRSCTSLTSVTIGNSVTSIVDYAFYNCTSLTNVTIGNSVTSIGDYVFKNCEKLEKIVYTGTLSQWRAIKGSDNISLIVTCKDTVVANEIIIENIKYRILDDKTAWVIGYIGEPQNLIIPSKIKYDGFSFKVDTIVKNAFKDCTSLKSVEIADSVTSIGFSAFYNCYRLNNVKLSKNIERIGSCVFQDCYALDSITIPDGVCRIESSTFDGSGLFSIVIPTSMTYINARAFRNCMSFSAVFYNGSKEDYNLTIDSDDICQANVKQYKQFICRKEFYNFTPCSDNSHNYFSDWSYNYGDCTHEGYKTRYCYYDGCVEKIIINPGDGHKYGERVVAPTCTEEGYTIHTCVRCHATYKDNYTKALGHKEVIDKAVAPTCTQSGLTEGKHCSVCNAVLVKQEKIDALGHKPVSANNSVRPTCTKDGKQSNTICSVCQETLKIGEIIKALGHSFSNNAQVCLNGCGVANPNYVAPTQPTPSQTPSTAPTQPNQNDTNTSNDEDVTVTSKPKSASIKKVKGAKKAILVTWKKVSGVSGYEIQLATDKKFKKNKKTVTIKKQKTTKTTVKKLKAKKKYYVRVRTYKIVNGKKVYSSWSKVKSVKTK